MEYPELEKTYKDDQIQALGLHRTLKNLHPPCWERCPNLSLRPTMLWEKNFIPKSNLNPSALTRAVYQLLPTSLPLFLVFSTCFQFFQSFTSAPFCSSSSTQSASATMQAQCRGLRVPWRQFTSAPWGAQEPPWSGTPPFPSLQKGHRNCLGVSKSRLFPALPIPSEKLMERNTVGSFARTLPVLIPLVFHQFSHQTLPRDTPGPGGPERGRKSLESVTQPEMPRSSFLGTRKPLQGVLTEALQGPGQSGTAQQCPSEGPGALGRLKQAGPATDGVGCPKRGSSPG